MSSDCETSRSLFAWDGHNVDRVHCEIENVLNDAVTSGHMIANVLSDAVTSGRASENVIASAMTFWNLVSTTRTAMISNESEHLKYCDDGQNFGLEISIDTS